MKYGRVATASTFLFVFLASISKVSSDDIWWHLKLGEYSLSSKRLIMQDVFSYTFYGKDFVNLQWFSDILLFAAYSFGGIYGLIILRATLVFLILAVVFKTAKKISEKEAGYFNPYIASCAILVGFFSMKFSISDRPHMLAYLLFAVYIYILESYRIKKSPAIWFIPFLQSIWVATSASFIFGWLLLFLYIAGELINWKVNNAETEQGRLKPLLILLGLAVIFTLVMPGGYKGAVHILKSSFSDNLFTANIFEWKPFKLSYVWGYEIRYIWGFVFFALFFITLMISNRIKDAVTIIVFFVFLVLALRHVRLIGLFTIAATPFLIREAHRFRRGILDKFRTGRIVFIASLSLVFYLFFYSSRTYSFGFGVKERMFPVKAADFIKSNNIEGRMFNNYEFGGYLIYYLYPEYQVFIDGRAQELYTEDFLKEYLLATESAEQWQRLTDKYGIDFAVVANSGKYYPKHLKENPAWKLVFWDDVSSIFIKESTNEDIIRKNEYKYR